MVILIDPIRSEDGQIQGFAYAEVDAAVYVGILGAIAGGFVKPSKTRVFEPSIGGTQLTPIAAMAERGLGHRRRPYCGGSHEEVVIMPSVPGLFASSAFIGADGASQLLRH